MNIEALTAARNAAHAAWKASPSAANKTALDNAFAALVAAKKAGLPAEAPADAGRAIAAQAARQQKAALTGRIRAAYALYEREQEWPRCGQDWPQTASEEAAQRLMDAHPAAWAQA